MANKYSVNSGDLFENGVIKDLAVARLTGSDVRIKASGTGSCKVVGKLTANGDYKVLSLVRLSDFAVVDAITDNEIYAADVSGLHSISLQSASGFTSVYAIVLA